MCYFIFSKNRLFCASTHQEVPYGTQPDFRKRRAVSLQFDDTYKATVAQCDFVTSLVGSLV